MKLLLTALAITLSYSAISQVFWTEAFENSCTSDCFAVGVNTGNGPWTVTNTGANGDTPNTWYVSCAENGQAAGQCGVGCGSDESLHISSQTVGDLGAAYDAGGLCGILWCTNTDQRAESPAINCSGYSNITLAFNYIENGQTTLDDATLWWFDGTTWAQLTNLAKTPTAGCGGQGLWTAYSSVLPAGANNNPNVKIGFRWVNNDDGAGTDPSFAVDDITLSVVASSNTITTGTITGSPFCACATVNVPFTSTGTFTAGNVYTAQLSNSTGSFAAPTSIGTLTSTANSGTITATIPCNTPAGTQYRIRVISSTPSVTGSDNGVNITVNAPPAAPTASVTTQPTCSTPTGTITVTAPTGASIQYSIGGAYQASTTFSGVAPGTYNVTAQNTTTGCISTSTSVTVNAVPTPPAAPTASVTVQPTCTTPTGTIVVTAPTGASIQYSVGGAYQASTTFTGLTPGSYNVTAQNTTTGCISTATVLTVNAVPAGPAAPTASVTVQPTCASPTGTIVVTAPSGANIVYSVGGAYQASGTFSGLAPATYNVTAQDNGTGCTSSATVLTVNAVPTPPAAPTASVTVQPTCSLSTGTIVVTAPSGANIVYSVGSAYQASGTFTGLTPATYNVTAQDNSTGCTSTATVLTVNAVPSPPTAPTASVTVQPTCSTPTGTIVVTAPTGANYEYSIGGAYQASATFSGLAPNTYNVTCQDISTGCISSATVLTVNAVAGAPVITVDTQTDVTCFGDTDGSASISVTGGSTPYSFAWSPTGGTNSSATGLAEGNYTVTVTDAVNCSSVANITVGTPAQIAIGDTETDVTCGSGGGQIITNVTGGTGPYTYAWTPNGETSSSITDITAGSYGLTVTDSDGCTSTGSYTITTIGSLTVTVTPASTTIDGGSSVQLTASGATTYSWLPVTGLSCTTCPDPVASPSATTLYTVSGSDAYGCAGTADALVNVNLDCGKIYVPNSFSPNGDLLNDKLVVGGLSTTCVPTYQFEVFDRWGEKVFETTDVTQHWDGNYKDKPMNTGVYFYKIYAISWDNTVLESSGNCTLVR